MDVLQVRLPDLRAIVMSHGHSDHHGGLEGMIRRVGARGMPLVIHPEAWRDRKVVFPTGTELHLPPPSRQDLDREGVEITNGGWEPDPWIWDDQAVVVNLKGKGLVALSGCSHSGAINVLRQAQRLTGEDRVHAFVGGMHLTGGIFERLIPRTLDESHRFPEAYVQTSVGTQLQFVHSR